MQHGVRILIFGAPGAGKDTQSAILSGHLGVPTISVGQLCRDEVARGTELSEYISLYMQRGLIVPGVARVMVREQIEQKGLMQTGYVINGYARTLSTLKDFLTWERPTHVIHLRVSDEIVYARLAERGRRDDVSEAIANKIAHYHNQEVPVCEFIREQTGIPYIEVDGNQSIETVTREILDFITLGRNS